MSFKVENTSGVKLSIDDLGLILQNGEIVDLDQLANSQTIVISANGGDLDTLITAGDLTVKDPFDGTTDLSATEGVDAARLVNQSIWRSATDLRNTAVQTLTSGDTPMIWGANNLLDIDGASAAISAIITSPPAVGSQLRIQLVTDAEATVGRELVVGGDTGIDVGGAGAATEWSRLLINREVILLHARSSTVIDIIHDGRIPCIGLVSGNWTHTSSGNFVTVDFGVLTVDENRGGVVLQGSDKFTVRRTNSYLYAGFGSHSTGGGGDTMFIDLNGPTPTLAVREADQKTSGTQAISVSLVKKFLHADDLDVEIFQDDSASESIGVGFSITEIL